MEDEDLSSMAEKSLSVTREAGSPSVAFDQGVPDGRLQPTYMSADRCLAQVEVCGCALESSAVRDRHETAERGDVEGSSHVNQIT